MPLKYIFGRSVALLKAAKESPGEVFLAEKMRRLIKLIPEESFFFIQSAAQRRILRRQLNDISPMEIAHDANMASNSRAGLRRERTEEAAAPNLETQTIK
jgi:hypothetical protein